MKVHTVRFVTHVENQLPPALFVIRKEASIRKLTRCPFSGIAPVSCLPVPAVSSFFVREDARHLFCPVFDARTCQNCVCARQFVSFFGAKTNITMSLSLSLGVAHASAHEIST